MSTGCIKEFNSKLNYDRLYEVYLNRLHNRSNKWYKVSSKLSESQKRWIWYFINLEAPSSVEFISCYYSSAKSLDVVCEKMGLSKSEANYLELLAIMSIERNLAILNRFEYSSLEERVKNKEFGAIPVSELSIYYKRRNSFNSTFRLVGMHTLEDILKYSEQSCIYLIRGIGDVLVSSLIKRLNELGVEHNISVVKGVKAC